MSDFPEITFPIFPEIFYTGEISGVEDAVLCARAMTAWGVTMSGFSPPIPPHFGEVMAKISNRLGILGTPESFYEWSVKFMTDKAEQERLARSREIR